MVTLQKVGTSITCHVRLLAMQGKAMPDRGTLRGKPIRRRPNAEGNVKINAYAWAHVWDGKPKACSWYG
jgi:hypothetical protein